MSVAAALFTFLASLAGLVIYLLKRYNAPESKIRRAMELKHGADELSNRQRINLMERKVEDFDRELDRLNRNIDALHVVRSKDRQTAE